MQKEEQTNVLSFQCRLFGTCTTNKKLLFLKNKNPKMKLLLCQIWATAIIFLTTSGKIFFQSVAKSVMCQSSSESPFSGRLSIKRASQKKKEGFSWSPVKEIRKISDRWCTSKRPKRGFYAPAVCWSQFMSWRFSIKKKIKKGIISQRTKMEKENIVFIQSMANIAF